ncbi:hypothetical protein CAPTEDRAFT_185762 [Capitella teleta]|uniref:DDE-1 domain-containing protein n=1 Tax=Capitella teleta TaxID=283909 RepID=R7VLH9_CAPTE|nr:hypothetical protein CAPTEDRAFT_185762 [Capitella teleta]|eukprot:ELU18281.1 hypothetical protein CAPTEDRAFT_185762 [Capitella teleta]
MPDPNAEGNPADAACCAAANAEIARIQEAANMGTPKRKRGEYGLYTDEQRLKIARYTVDNGPAKAAHHFSTLFGCPVNESTVRSIRNQYQAKQKVLFVACDPEEEPEMLDSLPRKKRDRSTLLPADIDSAVQKHLRAIRSSGGIVKRSIVLGSGRGIMSAMGGSTLLQENGGYVNISLSWAASLMKRIGFVQRKGTKAAKKRPENFSVIKQEFLDRITHEMIVNFDQTGLNIMPTGSWTLGQRGSKQLIYAGRTKKCHPPHKIPEDWEITHSDSHWSTTATMETYVERVLPLDLSGNADFKNSLKNCFIQWYADKVAMASEAGNSVDVDLRLSIMKPLHALWVHKAWNVLQENESALLHGWVEKEEREKSFI